VAAARREQWFAASRRQPARTADAAAGAGSLREAGKAMNRSITLGAAGLLLLLLVPTGPLLHEGMWTALGNAAHLPLMAAFTALVFFARARAGDAGRSGYPRAALLGAGATLVLEAIQPLFGRTASVVDAVTGLSGVAAALGGIHAWRAGTPRHRLAHGVATLVVCVVVLSPAWLEWTALRWRADRFPLLGAFEDEIELRLWRHRSPEGKWPTTLRLSSEHVSEGRRSLAVRTGDGAWPGVIYNAGGADWTGFERLLWDLYNPGEPFRLRVRIDDRARPSYETGYFDRIAIGTGWNRCELPTARIRRTVGAGAFDLGRVWRLALYTDGDEHRAFFIDNVRLARAEAAGSPASGGAGGRARVSSKPGENPGNS